MKRHPLVRGRMRRNPPCGSSSRSARARSGCCATCRPTCPRRRSPASCPCQCTRSARTYATSSSSSARTAAPRRSREPAPSAYSRHPVPARSGSYLQDAHRAQKQVSGDRGAQRFPDRGSNRILLEKNGIEWPRIAGSFSLVQGGSRQDGGGDFPAYCACRRRAERERDDGRTDFEARRHGAGSLSGMPAAASSRSAPGPAGSGPGCNPAGRGSLVVSGGASRLQCLRRSPDAARRWRGRVRVSA